MPLTRCSTLNIKQILIVVIVLTAITSGKKIQQQNQRTVFRITLPTCVSHQFITDLLDLLPKWKRKVKRNIAQSPRGSPWLNATEWKSRAHAYREQSRRE
jgi:hypothetical protein